MIDVVAETPRLRIRRLSADDVQALFDVYGDVDAMRFVGDGRALTHEQCEQWVTVTLRDYETRGYGMFAITTRDTGRVIGFAGLVHPNEHPTPELKYALRRDTWGHGFATEAAKGMLRYAISLGIHEIVATVVPDNAASMAVLLKAGMTTGGLRVDDEGNYTQVFVWRWSPR